MADVTVTAANVKPKGSTARIQTGTFGETVAQGKSVYLKTDGKYWLADADVLATAAAAGIAITAGAADGYCLIQTSGPIDVGGALTVGQVYVVSTTPGGIAPYSDLASGDYVTILGVASAAGQLELDISATGVAKA